MWGVTGVSVQGDPDFLRGLAFSGAAALLALSGVWWLFLSPLRPPQPRAALPTPRLAGWLAVLLGGAALQMVIGAFWDASQHLRTGIVVGGSDFLWPSHIMIYASFLLALLVAGAAMGAMAWRGWRQGERDPRRWARRQPLLSAVTLASLYELAAIPGDALWHEIFGIDLTAWSPPHLLLGMMGGAVVLASAHMLAAARPAMARPVWADAGITVLLALMLNMLYLVGVLEWELPQRSVWVDARPIWAYPLVGGGVGALAMVLARRLTTWRWPATAVALGFYVIRLGVTVGLDLTGNIAPSLPLVFLVGAVALDATTQASPARRAIVAAAAFTVGYALAALPQLQRRPDLHQWAAADVVLFLLLMTGVTWLLIRLTTGAQAAMAAGRATATGD